MVPPVASVPVERSKVTGSKGYDVERVSSIRGKILDSSQIRIDASKPDDGIAACAGLCNSTRGCAAFDVSVVYSKCTLYGSVEKKSSLGGYISGVRKRQ